MQRLDTELGRLIAAIRAGVDPALAAPQTREIQGRIAQARSLIERSERSRGSVGLLMEATVRAVLVETRDLVQLVRQADRIERAALSRPWTSASGTKEKRLFGIWRGAR